MGPPRHLALLSDLPDLTAERVAWPAPFADGLPTLLALRGRRAVALASGDPFWFGAGAVIARSLAPGEWRALPGPSTFSLLAARLGWRLEETVCLGLHAAPLTRLRPHLAPGLRAAVLLRDGNGPAALAAYLLSQGWPEARLTVLEALGGPRERRRDGTAAAPPPGPFAAPLAVALALDAATPGPALPRASGLPDDVFDTDGQITKRPMRALALSALAPLPGERLWDIGAGSGSIAVEWLLSAPRTQAVAVEPRADRAARIRRNADALGADRLDVVQGEAPGALSGLPPPEAVFIGGGLSAALLDALRTRLSPGVRLVAHAVTLESEALLAEAHARLGGDLMRVELAEAAPLGPRRGWRAAYPVVQWRTRL